jgi:hypothetical protein
MGEVDDADAHPRSRQRVRVRVRGHRPWGLAVAIEGHEGFGASIDYLDIAGPDRGIPRPHDFPIGAEFEAVIRNRLTGPEPPRWCYLVIPEAASPNSQTR